MKAFPMFIRTTGRRVVIVGGDEQAAQKARLIGKTDAEIVLAAPELDDELRARVAAGKAVHYPGPLDADLFAGAAMVFVASGCVAVDACAHAIAREARCLVNVVDQPHLCDLTTPSIVDRDPVVVAIGTEGSGPVLARQIKTKLEEQLPKNLGGLAALAGHLRASVAAHVPRAGRRAFWAWVFGGAPMAQWARGAEAHAARAIKDAIARGGAPDAARDGTVSFLGVPAGAPDLLSLRAVQRLQEADVIFHSSAHGAELLELARRDAERVSLGGEGDNVVPMEGTARLLIREARKGHRVVHVGTMCPFHDPMMAETRELMGKSGILCETIPGPSQATEHLAGSLSTNQPRIGPRNASTASDSCLSRRIGVN
ncbi:MAG: NAD(P)-dependent oxidoreductase [Pseudomonadota bacterium]